MNVVINNVIIKTRQGEIRGSAIDGVNSFQENIVAFGGDAKPVAAEIDTIARRFLW
jgi:hypothetical protein